MCCLHTLSSFRWVFLCVHVDVHTLELVCTVYVWTESSYAWFASCLFQSSRPILHLGRWEAFVKEALGVFLSRPVCFSDTQPGYLTCWWITQTVQSKFVFVRKRVCEGTWCIPPMTIWVFSTSLTVCASMCVQYTPLILAAVGGEKSEPCQPQNSQIWALSGCVDITIQNLLTFPIYPPPVWTPLSSPAPLFSQPPRLQTRLISLCLCEINSKFPLAAVGYNTDWRNSCCEA